MAVKGKLQNVGL